LSEAALNSQSVDFSHYQPILDRMPFGQLPANFGQAVPDPVQAQTESQVQAEKEKLAKQVNMSCVNVTPSGKVAIGFTDLSDKAPVNYYLLVGSSGGGWTVLDANYDEEWAQIKKDDITITLKLGQGLVDTPPAHAVTAAATTPVAAVPAAAPAPDNNASELAPARPSFIKRPSYGGRPALNTASLHKNRAEADQLRADLEKLRAEGGDIKSYMDRLRERKQQESAEKAAVEQAARSQLQELARKITEEELKKKEREMNLSLIEQGARPISDIELTPEEEQALVDRGVLAQ
jgi:hypothetical protein